MAVDGNILQREVVEASESSAKDVESLLVGFLKALLNEQSKAGEHE